MKVENDLKKIIKAEQKRRINENEASPKQTQRPTMLRAIKEEVASYCGISYNAIENIYKGYGNTTLKTALLLADYFKCSVEDIFFLKD